MTATLFGQRVPSDSQDVAAGAQCRAYELWTATIMHMMRVAEIGVGALADRLQVKRGATWGGTTSNVLKALENSARVKGDPACKQWHRRPQRI